MAISLVFSILCLAAFASAEESEIYVVGLLAVRNEVRSIQFCLRALAKHTDAIVILDDRSDDGTLEAIQQVQKECNIRKIVTKEGEWSQDKRDETGDRQIVLEEGRKIGGTHFIVIDGDEALTSNWANGELRDLLVQMKPGDIISMHWIFLWKSVHYFRTDRLYDNFGNYEGVGKELGAAMLPIFRDDGIASYFGEFIHTYRVPSVRGRTIHIQDSQLGLLHFQFVNWANVIIKQAWYKCMERVRLPEKEISEINNRYAVTLEEVGIRVATVNPAWFEEYTDFFRGDEYSALDNWRLDMMRSWLSQNESNFRQLQITELLSRHGISLFGAKTLSWTNAGGNQDALKRVFHSPPTRLSFVLFVARNLASSYDHVTGVMPLLTSLAMQNVTNFELILCAPVDEKDSISAMDIISDLAQKIGIKNVKIAPSPDLVKFEPRYEGEGEGDGNGRGLAWSASHNAGIRASRGHVILLTDGSVFLPPYFAAHVADFYYSGRQASMLAFPQRRFRRPENMPFSSYESLIQSLEIENEQIRSRENPFFQSLSQQKYEQIGEILPKDSFNFGFFPHWRWRGGIIAAPKSVFSYINGFDERWDLLWDTHLENFKDRAQITGHDVWLASRKLTVQRLADGVWESFSRDPENIEQQDVFDDSARMMGRIRWAKQRVHSENPIQI